MWCRVCEIETTESVCSICGYPTISENLGSVDNTVVHYCQNCKTPIVFKSNDSQIGCCPLCNGKTEYLTKDLRPVFPEERLLLELLLKKTPGEFENCSVWASNSRYYVNGKSYPFSSNTFRNANTDELIIKLEKNSQLITRDSKAYKLYEDQIHTFIKANKRRLDFIKDEAISFVKRACQKYEQEQIVNNFHKT